MAELSDTEDQDPRFSLELMMDALALLTRHEYRMPVETTHRLAAYRAFIRTLAELILAYEGQAKINYGEHALVIDRWHEEALVGGPDKFHELVTMLESVYFNGPGVPTLCTATSETIADSEAAQEWQAVHGDLSGTVDEEAAR